MSNRAAFAKFFEATEPLVRRALVSRFGPELGRDATAEGFTVAWRSWDRVCSMDNAPGYVYRTAERWASRHRPPIIGVQDEPATEDRYEDLELSAALESLSPRQRQAVVLVEGFGLSHREAAELLGCKRTSLQNHVERGMSRLRKSLEADNATR